MSNNLASRKVLGKNNQSFNALKQLLTYLSYLHSEGEISDKAFEALSRHAFSIYIEDSVQQKVNLLNSKLLEFLSDSEDT